MLLLNTSTLRALGGFRKWGKHRSIPIHDTCSNLGPFQISDITNFPSKGATQNHTSSDVARRLLGQYNKTH